MAEVYTLINMWHVIAAAGMLVLTHFLTWRAGDSNGYHRAPSVDRKRADEAEVKAELAEGREHATEKALSERAAALEADYARLRGAAMNLAFVAGRNPAANHKEITR